MTVSYTTLYTCYTCGFEAYVLANYDRNWNICLKCGSENIVKSSKFLRGSHEDIYDPQYATWKLYYLQDDRNGEIFYIGITSASLQSRLKYHLKDRKNVRKNERMYQIIKDGFKVSIHEFSPGLTFNRRQEAEKWERLLVWEALRDNIALTNIEYTGYGLGEYLRKLDNNTVDGCFEQIFQLIKKVILH